MNGHTFPEAAAILGITENWLRTHSTKLPRHKYGRTVVFTDDDLAAIAASHSQRPEAPAIPPTVLTLVDELRPLTSRKKARA